ncbi:MAG: hypothetical protein A2Y12_13275 [Planctomycetes bacterium GWF2_42_9]|nr:MAG: hypothetical protein A2Y12_13275 [Planctomycetes bacterium GWF2_42_9]HAL45926.1 hypothetical protein [Phycisphaerales bacterium]
MKMKRAARVISIIILFVSTSGYCVTIGNWQGAAGGDANRPIGSGNWVDAFWNNPPVVLPMAPGQMGAEIKIVRAGTSCIVDSNVGTYNCKLSIGGGTNLSNAAKLEIANGGFLGMDEIRVGSGGSASTGGVGILNQTGGTLNLTGKLFVGRFGTSASNPNEGKGFYSISGGVLTCSADTKEGGLYVGAGGSDGQAEGTFTIIGKHANINLRKLFVGSDNKKCNGIGTLEFKLEPNGVSPIRIADSVCIDAGGDESKAKLLVSAVVAAPKADILLIETLGSSKVTGIFDTVNEQAGAEVAIKTDDGIYHYKLTYGGGNGNNDVMLKYVNFEPRAAQ